MSDKSNNSPKILIVDDEFIIVADMITRLNRLGYHDAEHVHTGEEAIERSLSEEVDLVLMDIRLAGELDGIEAAERIRGRTSVPVIFVTAYSDDKRIQRAKHVQPFGYLVKPFQDHELKISIEMALYTATLAAERKETENLLRIQAEMGASFSAQTSLEDALETAARSVVQIGDIGCVGFYLPKNTPGMFKLVKQKGFSENLIQKMRLYKLTADRFAIIQAGRPVFITSRNESEAAWNPPDYGGLLFEGIVPLIHDEELVAVMIVSSRRTEEVPTQIQHSLVAIATLIAGVIARLRAEEALRESEERYRTIISSIEEGYYEVDLAGKIVFLNEALACDILGYKRPEDLTGKGNRVFMESETARIVNRTFKKIFETGVSVRAFGWELIKKDGSTCMVEISAGLIRNKNGKPIGFRGIARDITERERAQAEKLEREKIQAALETAGGACHELNQPLQTVLGLAELALIDKPDAFACMGHFQKILDQARKMADITQRLQSLTRYESKPYVGKSSILDLDKASDQ